MLVGTTIIGFVVLFLTGCGSGHPERGIVQGTVTLDGKPLTKGSVTFWPTVGRSALGEIQPDGSYTLTTFEPGDGAIVGSHKVTIEVSEPGTAAPAPTSFEEEVKMLKEGQSPDLTIPRKFLAPKRYTRPETTDLTAEIKSGVNRIDLKLSGK